MSIKDLILLVVYMIALSGIILAYSLIQLIRVHKGE